MSRLNEYDYEDAEDGMQGAVERAREREASDADEAIGSNLAMFKGGIDDVVGAQTTPALGGSSHIADAVASLEEPKMSDAYWRARETADAKREAAIQPAVRKLAPGEAVAPDLSRLEKLPHDPSKPPQMQLLASRDADFAREIGRQKMVEPGSSHIAAAVKQVEKSEPGTPPPTPADVAPTPPGLPESWESPFGQKKDEPKDETSAARLQAIRTIQRLASQGPPPPPAGQGDNEMAAAMRRDQAQRRMDNASEAMAAAFARRPARLMENIGEADILAAQRQGMDSSGAKRFNTELEANEKILSALGKPAAPEGPDKYDHPYFKSLGAAAQSLADARTEDEKRKKAADEAEAKSLENEKEVLARDPAFIAMGFKWPMIQHLDRKGLDAIRREVAAHKEPKAKGGTGGGGNAKALAAVKEGDISTVPAQYRDVVKAIADGRMEAPKASSRFGAEILKYVVAYKRDFDATKFGNYAAVSKQQATGKDVMALDVAREHLASARARLPKNMDTRFVNQVKQAIARGSGDPQFAPFIVAATVAGHELAKSWNVEDQHGKEEILRLVDQAQSPETLMSVFDTFDDLLSGKQHGIKRQMDRVAPIDSTKPVKTWRNKKTGRTTKGTEEQLKSSKSPEDWEAVGG